MGPEWDAAADASWKRCNAQISSVLIGMEVGEVTIVLAPPRDDVPVREPKPGLRIGRMSAETLFAIGVPPVQRSRTNQVVSVQEDFIRSVERLGWKFQRHPFEPRFMKTMPRVLFPDMAWQVGLALREAYECTLPWFLDVDCVKIGPEARLWARTVGGQHFVLPERPPNERRGPWRQWADTHYTIQQKRRLGGEQLTLLPDLYSDETTPGLW